MLVRIFDPSDADVADTSILAVRLASGVDGEPAPLPALEVSLDPASSLVRARYLLTSPTDGVALRIFDAAGREVRIVQWIDHAEAGEHDVEFSVGDLARGAYFVTLDAGGRTTARGIAVAP